MNYNNNFYGNQNNLQNNIYGRQGQAQNIYQQMNMNNYNNQRQQGYQNNYNQGNYNQNMYNQQNNRNPPPNQNSGPLPFITGTIGRARISAEDLQTFSKSIKEVEWTANINYMQAQNIPIRTKLIGQEENRNDVYIPRHRFNEYYLNSNFNPNEIIALITEVNDNNNKAKEQTDKEKKDFMRENFPSENADLELADLYKKIGEKRKEILEKDSSLYRRVEALLPLIKKAE